MEDLKRNASPSFKTFKWSLVALNGIYVAVGGSEIVITNSRFSFTKNVVYWIP